QRGCGSHTEAAAAGSNRTDIKIGVGSIAPTVKTRLIRPGPAMGEKLRSFRSAVSSMASYEQMDGILRGYRRLRDDTLARCILEHSNDYYGPTATKFIHRLIETSIRLSPRYSLQWGMVRSGCWQIYEPRKVSSAGQRGGG
ncbi:hypothetical protein RSAG8_10388, partial [Rhizoctonia solani AG-8 WAC10335]